MQVSYSSGRDEIFGQLELAKPDLLTLLGYAPIIVYQGLDVNDKLPTNNLWCRISQQTVLEEQTALAGNDLKRRYTTYGLIFVQIFIPKTKPEEYPLGLKAADIIKSVYRGKQTPNNIWFSNVGIRELPPEKAWFRINVVSEYQYDQIG